MFLLSPGHEKIDWTSLAPDYPIWKLPFHKPFQTTDEFVEYLVKMADHFSLNILERCQVLDISATGECFRVYMDDFHLDCRCLLISTGVFHNPYFPEIPGVEGNPRVIHSSQVRSPNQFKGKKITVVGAGNSGVELAVALSGESEVSIMCRENVRYYSSTGKLFDVRGLSESIFKELVYFKLINCFENCPMKAIEEGTIICKDGSRVEGDYVIMATGYRPVMLPLMGAHLETGLLGFPETLPTGESTSIPGLFFAGAIVGPEAENAFIHGYREKTGHTIMAVRETITGEPMHMHQ